MEQRNGGTTREKGTPARPMPLGRANEAVFEPLRAGAAHGRSQALAAVRLLSGPGLGSPGRSAPALRHLQRTHGNRFVQRLVAQLQRRDDGIGGVEVSPDIENGIRESRSGGQALNHDVRTDMEKSFRADLSDVRVHTDARADHLSRRLNAHAFATGPDIFFRSGQYQPGGSSGRKLLAHELTHVVQQRGATIQGKLTVSRPDDVYEQEADRVADEVMRTTSRDTADIAGSAGAGSVRRVLGDDVPKVNVPMQTSGGVVIARNPGPPGTTQNQLEMPAMTPEDMQNKLYALPGFEEHIPARLLEPTWEKLQTMKADLAKAPTDELRRDYNKLLNRYNISTLNAEKGGRLGAGYNTFAVVQLVDKDGKIIAVGTGKYIGGQGAHAEEIALDQIRAQIGTKKIPGSRVEVVGDKVICPDRCRPALIQFAKDYEADLVEGHVFQRERLVGTGLATEKTTRGTITMPGTKGLESVRKSETVFLRKGVKPPGGGGVAAAIVDKAAAANARKAALKKIVGKLGTAKVALKAATRAESLIPIVGWAPSIMDAREGVRDITHGDIILGLMSIGVAGVDIGSDLFHVGDIGTGVGGTALSLTIQGWTTAMQITLQDERVNGRIRELNTYIDQHGDLPPDLDSYFGLNDEEILILRGEISDFHPTPARPPDPKKEHAEEQQRKQVVLDSARAGAFHPPMVAAPPILSPPAVPPQAGIDPSSELGHLTQPATWTPQIGGDIAEALKAEFIRRAELIKEKKNHNTLAPGELEQFKTDRDAWIRDLLEAAREAGKKPGYGDYDRQRLQQRLQQIHDWVVDSKGRHDLLIE